MSPDNKNSITTMRTNVSDTNLVSGTQHIDLKVKQKGRSNLISNVYEEINRYGEARTPFEKFFSWIGWVDKNLFVLKLRNKGGVVRQVTIRNRSENAIDSIVIFANDIYLLTDIASNSKIEIPVRWSGKGVRRCSLHAAVYFANGKDIPRDYSDNPFSLKPKSEAELLDGKREKNEDCVDGEIIVQNKRIDYRVLKRRAE